MPSPPKIQKPFNPKSEELRLKVKLNLIQERPKSPPDVDVFESIQLSESDYGVYSAVVNRKFRKKRAKRNDNQEEWRQV